MAMRTRAPKRYRDADIAAMQRYRFNPYKEALLNPISGPLVGVPTSVPIDTYRVRIKATRTVTVSGGQLAILVNPVAALCSDAVPYTGTSSGVVGPLMYDSALSITTIGGSVNWITSNAPYTRSQFAGVNAANSVRGRVVSACVRICNVSSTNTRNGVFTLYKDPQHTTLQGKSASTVAADPRARQYNASTTDWHNVLYHPVEPEETDGWVWDPQFGPQAGTKTVAANPGGTGDSGPADTQPGYMGIWYNGDAVSQSFQIELYVIAEYVGQLAQPLVTENEAVVEDAQEARHTAENNTVWNTPAEHASNDTNHPESSGVRRVLQFGKEHSQGLITAGKIGLVGIAGKMGGAGAARGAAELLFSPGTIQRANQYNDYYNSYANRGRTPANQYINTPSRSRLTY